ncbi:MAG: hypothetical protein H0V22_03360 [Solirubrobacterales bacterium]|nr:hypothetical protein [Solirubrobacterales bacterium]
MSPLEPRTLAHVVFDESHREAWTIRPEVAKAMQPAHPEDASYARAAALLTAREFSVAAHTDGPLDVASLQGADVLVIAHPSDPAWERTVPGGVSRLSGAEIDSLEEWVLAGGGLIVLGETEQDKYGNNSNELLERFGLRIEHDTVQDYGHSLAAPSWVLGELERGARGMAGDLLARVDSACFYRTGTITADREDARVLARASAAASSPRAPLAAVTDHGAGRVAVLADSDLFGDDCLGDLGHTDLWLNLVYWAAGNAFSKGDGKVPSAAAADGFWIALKAEVEALRARQEADGSVDLGRHEGSELDTHIEAIAASVAGMAVHFPHQSGYLAAVIGDLWAWRDAGYGRPDFSRSLEAFRPDRQRTDGIEHLVLFPMYKQNGPAEKVFEALIVRVPWPAWLAGLEGARFDNPKFVPVTFVDHTSGYDSESAVLFPETVTVAEKAVNHFGAIFCDREGARLRRTLRSAAEVLRLNLPPDAAALMSSPLLSEDAFVLWDLIHDRAHSRGDLPFDPFMIRQRAPYWMYGLEELRCDLTAFGEAMKLEDEGFPLGRHVQYAILFDRLFRFPITGARRRNYDGLGGQLLFAYLHTHGHLHWTDNELTIEWDTVARGVAGLRDAVVELYRTGIDRSKLRHWCAAHDLVASYVAPAEGSAWVAGTRDFVDIEDPRPYVDSVLDDEFPLSIFYTSLKRKLEADAQAVAA